MNILYKECFTMLVAHKVSKVSQIHITGSSTAAEKLRFMCTYHGEQRQRPEADVSMKILFLYVIAD